MERPGVYAIEHCPTRRVYIGSTSNLSKRWSRHRQELRNGIHRNRHLQATWSRDGADSFRWRVLVVVEPSARIWFEQRAIDHWQATDPRFGFNRAAIAGVSYGATGRIWTAEQRANASLIQKRLKPLLPVGSLCPKGHVKDGTYTRTRPNGSVSIRCQECERLSAFARERRKRGVPFDQPRGKHFNQRGA